MSKIHSMVEQAIEGAWSDEVQFDYASARIFSERELQAVLYAALRGSLDMLGLRVFIEPTLQDDENRWFPDVVVAEQLREETDIYRAIAIIELKLDRGLYIRFEGELDRLIARKQRVYRVAEQRAHAIGKSLQLILDAETIPYLGFIGSGPDAHGSGGCVALYAREVISTPAGRSFLESVPDVARATRLLFGRLLHDGTTEFGVERLVAPSDVASFPC